jgi:hypothetical protein
VSTPDALTGGVEPGTTVVRQTQEVQQMRMLALTVGNPDIMNSLILAQREPAHRSEPALVVPVPVAGIHSTSLGVLLVRPGAEECLKPVALLDDQEAGSEWPSTSHLTYAGAWSEPGDGSWGMGSAPHHRERSDTECSIGEAASGNWN